MDIATQEDPDNRTRRIVVTRFPITQAIWEQKIEPLLRQPTAQGNDTASTTESTKTTTPTHSDGVTDCEDVGANSFIPWTIQLEFRKCSLPDELILLRDFPWPKSLSFISCQISNELLASLVPGVQHLCLRLLPNNMTPESIEPLFVSIQDSLQTLRWDRSPEELPPRLLGRYLNCSLPHLRQLTVLKLDGHAFSNTSGSFLGLMMKIEDLPHLRSLELLSLKNIVSFELLMGLSAILSKSQSLTSLSVASFTLKGSSSQKFVDMFAKALQNNQHLTDLNISWLVGLGAHFVQAVLESLRVNHTLVRLRIIMAVMNAPPEWFEKVPPLFADRSLGHSSLPHNERLKASLREALYTNTTLTECTIRFASQQNQTFQTSLAQTTHRNKSIQIIRQLQDQQVGDSVWPLILAHISRGGLGGSSSSAIMTWMQQHYATQSVL